MRAKKSLGQHFLTSKKALESVVGAAHLDKRDIVLEVGPGEGVLTRELLAQAQKVIAIEKDPRMVALLGETFAEEIHEGRLRLVEGDARDIDRAALGLREGGYKVVANIPYYLTGTLLRETLAQEPRPSAAVFLLQKEVAERIARSKKESLLSLSVKAYGVPRYIATVQKRAFRPAPKVDSAVLAIGPVSADLFKDVDEADFFKLLHLGFGKKRKQLLGNLAAEFPRERLERCFSALNLPLDVRAEDLDLAQWKSLAQMIL